jgi:hypothetical protein
MSFSRVVLVSGLLAAFAGALGCSAAPTAEKEDAESYESELRLSGPRYLGQIANGETKTNYYSNPPRYRAFGFYAKGGDEITADVASVNGDGMGWITTSSYDALAANDDASRYTFDAKVVYKVPDDKPSRAYRIVFRDYDLLDATFTVKLTIKSAAPVTCSYGDATYNEGDTFAANDDCNTCSCSSTGSATCTKKACVCNPEAEPWRNYIGTPTTCQTIRYSCTTDKRPFQNACGCGCEALTH